MKVQFGDVATIKKTACSKPSKSRFKADVFLESAYPAPRSSDVNKKIASNQTSTGSKS